MRDIIEEMQPEHPAWETDDDCDESTNTTNSPESVKHRKTKKKPTKDEIKSILALTVTE